MEPKVSSQQHSGAWGKSESDKKRWGYQNSARTQLFVPITTAGEGPTVSTSKLDATVSIAMNAQTGSKTPAVDYLRKSLALMARTPCLIGKCGDT